MSVTLGRKKNENFVLTAATLAVKEKAVLASGGICIWGEYRDSFVLIRFGKNLASVAVMFLH